MAGLPPLAPPADGGQLYQAGEPGPRVLEIEAADLPNPAGPVVESVRVRVLGGRGVADVAEGAAAGEAR